MSYRFPINTLFPLVLPSHAHTRVVQMGDSNAITYALEDIPVGARNRRAVHASWKGKDQGELAWGSPWGGFPQGATKPHS